MSQRSVMSTQVGSLGGGVKSTSISSSEFESNTKPFSMEDLLGRNSSKKYNVENDSNKRSISQMDRDEGSKETVESDESSQSVYDASMYSEMPPAAVIALTAEEPSLGGQGSDLFNNRDILSNAEYNDLGSNSNLAQKNLAKPEVKITEAPINSQNAEGIENLLSDNDILQSRNHYDEVLTMNDKMQAVSSFQTNQDASADLSLSMNPFPAILKKADLKEYFSPKTESLNSIDTFSNQTDTTNETTSTQQLLTKHFGDFLAQNIDFTTNSSETQPSTTAPNIQSRITMELISIKPDTLADSAGVKLDSYTAQINIHPEEFGPISAKIEVNNGMANLTFMTEHTFVKQLMEKNVNELHDAFQQSNLYLNAVDIQHNGSQDKQQKQQPELSGFEDEEDVFTNKIAVRTNVPSARAISNLSIIDTYA